MRGEVQETRLERQVGATFISILREGIRKSESQVRQMALAAM